MFSEHFSIVINNNKYNRHQNTLELGLTNKKGYETFSFYFLFKKDCITNKFILKEYFLDLEHDNYGIDSILLFKDGYFIFKYENKTYKYYLNKLSLKNSQLNQFITSLLRYRFEIQRLNNMKKMKELENA